MAFIVIAFGVLCYAALNEWSDTLVKHVIRLGTDESSINLAVMTTRLMLTKYLSTDLPFALIAIVNYPIVLWKSLIVLVLLLSFRLGMYGAIVYKTRSVGLMMTILHAITSLICIGLPICAVAQRR